MELFWYNTVVFLPFCFLVLNVVYGYRYLVLIVLFGICVYAFYCYVLLLSRLRPVLYICLLFCCYFTYFALCIVYCCVLFVFDFVFVFITLFCFVYFALLDFVYLFVCCWFLWFFVFVFYICFLYLCCLFVVLCFLCCYCSSLLLKCPEASVYGVSKNTCLKTHHQIDTISVLLNSQIKTHQERIRNALPNYTFLHTVAGRAAPANASRPHRRTIHFAHSSSPRRAYKRARNAHDVLYDFLGMYSKSDAFFSCIVTIRSRPKFKSCHGIPARFKKHTVAGLPDFKSRTLQYVFLMFGNVFCCDYFVVAVFSILCINILHLNILECF